MYWPEDGSLEQKHVANYVLMTTRIYVLCLTELIISSYCIPQPDGPYKNKAVN